MQRASRDSKLSAFICRHRCGANYFQGFRGHGACPALLIGVPTMASGVANTNARLCFFEGDPSQFCPRLVDAGLLVAVMRTAGSKTFDIPPESVPAQLGDWASPGRSLRLCRLPGTNPNVFSCPLLVQVCGGPNSAGYNACLSLRKSRVRVPSLSPKS
jgi:hypothetical protein